MMRVLVLALATLCAGATRTPAEQQHHELMKDWDSFVGRKFGGIHKTALLKRFANGARLCMQGKCGGLEQATQFENAVDEMHLGFLREQVVVGEGFMAAKWFSVVRTGQCEKNWAGSYVAYLNEQGKIKEYHNWFDMDVSKDLQWMQENCIQDTSKGGAL